MLAVYDIFILQHPNQKRIVERALKKKRALKIHCPITTFFRLRAVWRFCQCLHKFVSAVARTPPCGNFLEIPSRLSKKTRRSPKIVINGLRPTVGLQSGKDFCQVCLLTPVFPVFLHLVMNEKWRLEPL